MTINNKPISLPAGAKIQTIGKNKTTYVFIPTYYWDKEAGRGKAHRRYIGKIVNDQFIPNDEYLKAQKEEIKTARTDKKIDQALDEIKSAGADIVLKEVCRQTGLAKDLIECYGEEVAKKLLSLAMYQIYEGANYYRFNGWQALHETPFNAPIASPRSSELLALVGKDFNALNRLFALRKSRLAEDEYLSFDSTRIASQSEHISDVRYAPAKTGQMQMEIGLALLYGHKSEQPVMFKKLPGNVVDVITIAGLLSNFDELNLDTSRITAIFDRGYNSKENIARLINSKCHFVIGISTGLKTVKDYIDDYLADFWMVQNQCSEVDGYANSYEIDAQKFADKKLADVKGKKVYLHLFRSNKNSWLDEKAFFKRVDEFEKAWKEGKAKEDSPILEYFTVNADKTLTRNIAALEQKSRFFGFFGFLTDKKMTAKEALSIYRLRDGIEKSFQALKSECDLHSMAVHGDETLDGKMLVCFIAQIILAYLLKHLSAPFYDEKGNKQLPLVKTYSLMEALDELECIRLVKIKGRKPRLTEITSRQKNVLCGLGLHEAVQNYL